MRVHIWSVFWKLLTVRRILGSPSWEKKVFWKVTVIKWFCFEFNEVLGNGMNWFVFIMIQAEGKKLIGVIISVSLYTNSTAYFLVTCQMHTLVTSINLYFGHAVRHNTLTPFFAMRQRAHIRPISFLQLMKHWKIK